MLFNQDKKQNNTANRLRIVLAALLCIALICASSVGLSFLGSHTKYFDVSYVNITKPHLLNYRAIIEELLYKSGMKEQFNS